MILRDGRYYAGGKKDDKNYDVEVRYKDPAGVWKRREINVWAYNRNAAAAAVKRLFHNHEICSVNRVG